MSQLFLPLAPKEPRSRQRTVLYTVKRGDSLELIARRHNMDRGELRAMNNLKENAALLKGQILQVFRKKRRSHSMPALPEPLEPADGPDRHHRRHGHKSHVHFDRGNNEEQENEDANSDGGWVVLPSLKQRSHSERGPVLSEDEPEPPVLIGGTPSDILSRPLYAKTLVPKIDACLPAYHRGYDWKLLYSLAHHGCSLHTLLTKVRGQAPTILVVETALGDVFGAFSTVAWSSATSYYGIGESFVFTNQPKFEHFRWSRLNTMLMLSNDQSIAMGGGGHFAWYMNSDLSSGSSGHSDTFNNRCLTSESTFEIVSVEVWGFVMKQ